jgi:hypothetical protein
VRKTIANPPGYLTPSRERQAAWRGKIIDAILPPDHPAARPKS